MDNRDLVIVFNEPEPIKFEVVATGPQGRKGDRGFQGVQGERGPAGDGTPSDNEVPDFVLMYENKLV